MASTSMDSAPSNDGELLTVAALLAAPEPILSTGHQATAHAENNPSITPWDFQSAHAAHAYTAQPTLVAAKRPLLHKPSVSSFSFNRAGSSPSYTTRGSDAHSTRSDSLSSSTLIEVTHETIKPKASLSFISDMIRKRSRAKLSSDANDSIHTLSYSSPNHSSYSVADPITSSHRSSSPTSNASVFSKKEKDKTRATRRLNKPPPLPPKDAPPEEPIITLDTDFTHIDDIIRPGLSDHPRSNLSTVGSSGLPRPFYNPFLPGASSERPPPELRRVSPKTILSPNDAEVGEDYPIDHWWTAPESWAVEKDDQETVGGGGNSSSEGESVIISSKKKMRRKTYHSRKQPSPTPTPGNKMHVRIYRVNGSYHVARVMLHSTVAEIAPQLNSKMLLDKDVETHKLYLKERGRERVLAPTERPAAITRRRLEQAGYDEADRLQHIAAEDMSFLLKFVYRSRLPAPSTQDFNFDNFEYVDLTGCSLPTIPIIFHQNAGSIVYLNLSRNPMVEIPLDFIQACVTLRELRLSSMAMKKVPQSVRYSTSLHRLDLSCNRIADLDDAGLDRISELNNLKLQNNRMEQLPWYLPRLRMLRALIISNNKFTTFPSVICEMPDLVDLDISFNMITELPENIGKLAALQRFVFVGNQVSRLPGQFSKLDNLLILDCRRNNLADLSVAHTIPNLEMLLADHNYVHALDLSQGPFPAKTLDASHNDITILKLVPTVRSSFSLTSLDVSYAKLSSLDDFALSHLSALRHLKLDHNLFRTLPESLGELSHLLTLSCSDNHLDALPGSIGALQRLEVLDAHNNSLTQLPDSLWNCASLSMINVTSNLLKTWSYPSSAMLVAPPASGISLDVPATPPSSRSHYPVARKLSNTPSLQSLTQSLPGRPLPPLAYSLERLYVGENRLTDEALPPFTVLKELRVLNLSFNDIQEMPSSFFRNLTKLEELYLGGNQLTSIPTEDLHRLTRLTVLFLNGNKLQTLPQELGKVPSLTVLDVGSNVLRYNINNWEFDWNWNFNQNLKYLNLSGNKRLEIKPGSKMVNDPTQLANFSEMSMLRVLGLMDVTTTFLPNIPEESEDRRVRTSLSEVNKMSYGIADTLGQYGYLTMFDLVQPEFRGHKDEAVFAMFGRSQAGPANNHISKYLHDNLLSQLSQHLNDVGRSNGGVTDALRRTFLRLNKELHDTLYSGTTSHRKMSQASASTSATSTFDQSYIRGGASGIVLYFAGKTLHVANAGQALAVISTQGSAELISKKHDPFDRTETARIRAAEGWVSPKGLIHEEIDTSRSFGFFHDFPVVNARPDIFVHQLTEQDEFVIIANRGLWDYISYQTAVDIARSEIADPMIAAQKLRDFAISYGSSGSIMIMVICVADLFRVRKLADDALVDAEAYGSLKKRGPKKTDIADRTIARLDGEVSPPTGHVCLVFTDIRNSTQLWEANAGMPTAMRLHNSLLHRHLRICGGYVVKTEGDAFMCAFPTTLSAVWWAMVVQLQLLHEPWPMEILECDEGKEVRDADGNLIARGLSVRMGMHCGIPVCETDLITNRMDYFGPMVIRAARISGNARGGQIMCSADVVREINARVMETGPDTEYSEFQPPQAIEAIRRMNIKVIPVGEIKLKGLEVPEMVSLIYPGSLTERYDFDLNGPSVNSSSSPAKVPWSVEQVRNIGVLSLRFEALASSRVFKPYPKSKESGQEVSGDELPDPSLYMYGDPDLLLPPLNDKMTEPQFLMVLDSLVTRLENAASSFAMKIVADHSTAVIEALQNHDGLDTRTLNTLVSLLRNTHQYHIS